MKDKNKLRQFIINECTEQLNVLNASDIDDLIFHWFHDSATYMILTALIKQIQKCKDDDKLIDVYKQIFKREG